jgi:hemolysin III
MNLKSFPAKAVRLQTVGEEIANSVLHGLGALLAAIGFIPLVLRAKGLLGGTDGGEKAVAASVIYASTMLIMFLASTLYHAIRQGAVKRFFKIIDHSAIYLLIAGTYTPICFMVLPVNVGLPLFIFEWLFAAAGITLHAVNWTFLKRIEVILYCVMGWAIAFAAPYLKNTMSVSAIIMLAAGGVAYSVGIIFYKKPQLKLCHVIWHVFVLVGAVCHWYAVFLMSHA